jgi:hypothetical protein
VQVAKHSQEDLLSQIVVVISWAERPAGKAVHHRRKTRPNPALGPHLSHKGRPHQDGVIDIATNARTELQVDRSLFGGRGLRGLGAPAAKALAVS